MKVELPDPLIDIDCDFSIDYSQAKSSIDYGHLQCRGRILICGAAIWVGKWHVSDKPCHYSEETEELALEDARQKLKGMFTALALLDA